MYGWFVGCDKLHCNDDTKCKSVDSIWSYCHIVYLVLIYHLHEICALHF